MLDYEAEVCKRKQYSIPLSRQACLDAHHEIDQTKSPLCNPSPLSTTLNQRFGGKPYSSLPRETREVLDRQAAGEEIVAGTAYTPALAPIMGRA